MRRWPKQLQDIAFVHSTDEYRMSLRQIDAQRLNSLYNLISAILGIYNVAAGRDAASFLSTAVSLLCIVQSLCVFTLQLIHSCLQVRCSTTPDTPLLGLLECHRHNSVQSLLLLLFVLFQDLPENSSSFKALKVAHFYSIQF